MKHHLYHLNIAGRRKPLKIKRILKKRKYAVIVTTESYRARRKTRKWAEKFGYQHFQPSKRNYGGEGPNIITMIRNDVPVAARSINEMNETWFGPFNYPRSKRDPRVFSPFLLRFGTKVVKVVGVHLPPGGPSGGVLTKGRNAPAWHESAEFVKRTLKSADPSLALGDCNANGKDVRKFIKPAGGTVRMATNVDGAISNGCSLTVKKLKAPRGMHGAFRATITI